jgi:acylphosphatase
MTPANHEDDHTPDETVRATLRITGLVQGVFYRASARKTAERLGLRGFAGNELDGSVRAVVEGPRKRVEDFVDWCHQGPPAARVEAVHTELGPASGEFDGFRITR